MTRDPSVAHSRTDNLIWSHLAWWSPLALTASALAIATIVRLSLTPLWGSGYTFIAYYPAIMLAAAAGGWKHGLAATLISTILAVFLFLEPAGMSLEQVIALGFFVAANVVVTFLLEVLRRARSHAETEAIERGDALEHERTLHAETDARLRAEQALRASEGRNRAILEQAVFGVAVADLKGRFIEANQAYCAITGYTAQELLDTDLPSITHAEDRDANMSLLRQMLAGEIPGYVIEKRYVRKDAKHVWVRNAISLIRDAAGSPVSIATLTYDLTDRKQVEQELRHRTERLTESEERYRTLFASAPMAVFVCDRDAVIQHYNQRALELWGREPQRGVERHCGSVKLWLPDGTALPHEQSPMVEVLRTGIPALDVEVLIERPDGSRLPVLVNFAALKDAHGKITGAVTSFIDIAKRKRAEALQSDQRRVLQLIAEDAPLSAVLEALVLMVEKQSDGEMLGSVLLMDPDGIHLRHGAAPSLPATYNEAINGIEIGPAAGSCGTAAHSKKPVYVSDIANDPLWANFRDLALTHDLRACWSTPVLSGNGDVLGTFAMYYREARHPGELDLKLVEATTRTAAIAIERKLTDQAMRRRTAQFETLLDEAPLGVYLVDADFRIRQVNPTARPVFGDIPDLIGRDFDEVIHLLWPKAQADEVIKRFRHTLDTGEPYVVPEWIEDRRDSGEREFYEWQIHRIPLPEGSHGVVCYFRDISSQVEAREAIAQSEQRLRFMAESMPQKIFTARPNGDVDYFNQQWTEFTGLSFEQIKNWGWTQFIHPHDVTENVRVWQRSIATGEPFVFEHRFRRADGEYRWHISRALPMRNAQGGIVMWIGSNTDIHDVKTAQEALQEADRRKDEFLATLSHELRNPLAPIRTAVELLGDAADDPVIMEQARGILARQVNHMITLVDDLLELSRISRGSIALHKQEVDLADIVASAVETSRPSIEAASHRLEISLPEQPIILFADSIRVAQILANLLNNAAKYTSNKGLIQLRVYREARQAVISVRDNGIGISPDMLSRVFDMFVQGNNANRSAQGGLGIGLSLARTLAGMHDGSIEARSDGPGRGSEFIVRMPILASGWLAPASRVDATAAAVASRRVLVIDDNVDAADTLGMLLRQMGHEVRIAYDGPAAMEAASADPPEIVLLDISLPEMDGYAVAERLRNDRNLDGVRIVALSGYGQEEDRQRSRQAGFDEHLVKPIAREALQSLLDR